MRSTAIISIAPISSAARATASSSAAAALASTARSASVAAARRVASSTSARSIAAAASCSFATLGAATGLGAPPPNSPAGPAFPRLPIREAIPILRQPLRAALAASCRACTASSWAAASRGSRAAAIRLARAPPGTLNMARVSFRIAILYAISSSRDCRHLSAMASVASAETPITCEVCIHVHVHVCTCACLHGLCMEQVEIPRRGGLCRAEGRRRSQLMPPLRAKGS